MGVKLLEKNWFIKIRTQTVIERNWFIKIRTQTDRSRVLGFFFGKRKVKPSPSDNNVVVVGWLLNVPATCECILGTDLLRQFYVLPH